MMNKELLIYYKYSLQDIIGVVNYLYNLLLNRKQQINKIMAPFIDQYCDRLEKKA